MTCDPVFCALLIKVYHGCWALKSVLGPQGTEISFKVAYYSDELSRLGPQIGNLFVPALTWLTNKSHGF